MNSNRKPSILFVSDIQHFIKMKDFWDQEMQRQVDDPLLFSSMIIEQWKCSLRIGEHPFLLIIKKEGRIIGFAPLIFESHFGFRRVRNFNEYLCAEFFSDPEICMELLINYLFRSLNCESIDITFRDELNYQGVMEQVCTELNRYFSALPGEGNAIIPVKNNVDLFRKSLKRKDRKELERIKRKLSQFGTWQVSCFDWQDALISKILKIERCSWKAELEGKKAISKDLGLNYILNGIDKNMETKSFFGAKACFLMLDDLPIAYVIELIRNRVIYFAKTSYDQKFRRLWPGIILMNEIIEDVTLKKKAERIDFISNLPFIQIWNPVVKKRVNFKILQNVHRSKVRDLVFQNRVSLKFTQVVERYRMKKVYSKEEKLLRP
jgi:hypothetical protein